MFKNALIRLLLCFFGAKPRSSPPIPPKRILVVTTTGLGDTLWATPALESLRESFPHAYIAALTSPIGFEVLQHNPFLNRLYEWKEPLLRHFLALWRALKKEAFDTVLLFHASQRLALPLAALLGAHRLVGLEGGQKGFEDLFTRALPRQREHEIQTRLRLVEAIGGRRTTERLSLFLEKKESANRPSPTLRIALHPGSKDSYKRWPKEQFALVGQALQERFGCEILITGTKEERRLMEALQALLPRARLLEESLPLRSFAKELQGIDLLIANDTGPVHLACALNRPVVALYAATDPALCGPHRALNAVALFRRATCTPCLKRSCRRPFCLLQIGADEVIQAAAELLRLKRGKSQEASTETRAEA